MHLQRTRLPHGRRGSSQSRSRSFFSRSAPQPRPARQGGRGGGVLARSGRSHRIPGRVRLGGAVAGRYRGGRCHFAGNLLGDRNLASTTFFAVANAGGPLMSRDFSGGSPARHLNSMSYGVLWVVHRHDNYNHCQRFGARLDLRSFTPRSPPSRRCRIARSFRNRGHDCRRASHDRAGFILAQRSARREIVEGRSRSRSWRCCACS